MSKTSLLCSPLALSDPIIEAKSAWPGQTVALLLRQAAARIRAAFFDRPRNWWELNDHHLRDIGRTRAEAECEKILRCYGTHG